MKNYQLFKSIGILAIAVVAIVIVNMVGAAGNYPPQTPPITGAAKLLDISTVPQAKIGDLAVGATTATYAPTKTLDVTGAAVFDILGVLGKAWFADNFKIGASAPVNTDTELYVQGSRIRSIALANPNGESICADDLGRLVLCSTVLTPTNGMCGSANGTTPASAPTTGLCSVGTASTVAGNGPWTWTCSGLNGGTTAPCATVVAPTQPLSPPAPIFYSAIFSGNQPGGAHDGLEWPPVPVPGTSQYAVRYEMQTFNPEKNFALLTGQCPNPMETPNQFGFCPISANANDWVTFGIIDYSQGITTSATYTNWTSGTTTPWNARIWDFFSGWGPNGWSSQTNLEGGLPNTNGCFTSQSITGCAVRIRALYGGTASPWSPVTVLYDPIAPKNLTCKQKNPVPPVPQYEFARGVQNLVSGNCGTPSGSTINSSLKLEWEKSMRDHQTNPFLTYQVAVACSPTLGSQKYAVLNGAATNSRLILPQELAGLGANPSNQNCMADVTSPFKTFDETSGKYRIIPNTQYPEIDLNYTGGNINGGQSPVEGEQGFITVSQ